MPHILAEGLTSASGAASSELMLYSHSGCWLLMKKTYHADELLLKAEQPKQLEGPEGKSVLAGIRRSRSGS